MGDILLVVGWFAFGLLIGAALASWFWVHNQARMNVQVLKKMLASQDYEIRDGKIMAVESKA